MQNACAALDPALTLLRSSLRSLTSLPSTLTPTLALALTPALTDP